MATTFKETYTGFHTEAEHFVQFYEAETFFLDSLSTFIGTGLATGEVCVVIGTQAHLDSLEERLEANGLALPVACSQGRYISLEASETLSRFMVDGLLVPELFTEVVGNVIAQAAKSGNHVRVFGELVALLWMRDNRSAALQLEELWNDLYHNAPPFSLFCAYPMHGFNGEVYGRQFTEICNQHSRVIPGESYTALASSDEQLRAIALLQQKANSLEAEIAERKELERRKDEFISMASHELKTPVTALKGFTQLLLRRFKSRNDEESLRFLTRMDSQINKLTKLICDLLDISKMQSGQLEYRMEAFDLAVLAQEILENMQGTTQTHRLLLEQTERAPIFGDRDRIGQVLINLLTNAIKYSPDADRIIVRIITTEGKVLASVQDFGIGIAEAYQEKIFERFYQVNEPAEKTYPGLGIGLYIAGEIIKRHQGQLRVQSQKEEGSIFSFCLPLYA